MGRERKYLPAQISKLGADAMRVVDKLSPNEAEMFWIHVGKMSVHAMLTDRPLSDFVIEDKQEVIDAAMAEPQDVRDEWFRSGVLAELAGALKADAQRHFQNPDSPSIVAGALVRYLTHLMSKKNSLFPFEITARAVQPSKATRKIVSHDKSGRIASFLEVEESVVV
jgi:hypothetical protein